MPRTILLSGALGSGKSTVMTLGYRALEKYFGPTAVIDTDTILMMVDPKWELEHDERRLELAGWQCWLLARSFLDSGFDCVIVGGNGWHTPDEGLNDMIWFLLGVGDVYHVTLDPELPEIQRRVAGRGGDHSEEWLAEHVEWMRARYRGWTCRIDNTTLGPEETVAEIARRIEQGEGRITSALPSLCRRSEGPSTRPNARSRTPPES